ncbi:MAG: hypothetical protein COB15_03315 [Flavobacteriales bacterium]|nr:MAG: hypothetical protein COB15_03315 [Flavobacteriales bacterium]
MIELTRSEKKLNHLINEISNNRSALDGRTELLEYALMMVSTLSQDSRLNELSLAIESTFPEYGKRV